MFSRELFSERIKKLRKDKKVNQIELAELLGVTRTQISDLENGKTTTSIERLYTLADYFNVSVDYLLCKSDNPHAVTVRDLQFLLYNGDDPELVKEKLKIMERIVSWKDDAPDSHKS